MLTTIYKWLCRFAGVREDAIRRAPNAMVGPAMFGLVLLCTTTTSGLMAAYALSRVFYGSPFAPIIALIGGAIWWTLVYGVDRLMLNMGNSGPQWKKLLKAGARVAVATLFGLSISIPLFLRIERNSIDLALYRINRASIAQEAAENAQRAGLPDSQEGYGLAVSGARKAEDALAAGPGASPDYVAATRSREAAESALHSIEDRDDVELQNAETRLITLPAGARASSPLEIEIQQLRTQIREARQQLARTTAAVDRAEAEWRRSANNRIEETRKDASEARQSLIAAAEVAGRNDAISAREIARLSTPNLATEFDTAEKVMADPKNPESASMKTLSRILHSLFIGIELLIVTLKLTTPETAMDRVVAAVEEEEREQITLQANAMILRVQAATDAVSDLYQHGVQQWHAQRLQQVQQSGPLATNDLQELKQECAAAILAAI
jgi:hypothetical protein